MTTDRLVVIVCALIAAFFIGAEFGKRRIPDCPSGTREVVMTRDSVTCVTFVRGFRRES